MPGAGFPIRRILAVTGIALATANCSTSPQKLAAGGGSTLDPKYGVKASPRLYNEGDVIPKGGGRRFSGKPYVVAGRTYVPREDARGYVREGLASWYGSAFHGRMTANGEVFDRHSIAAAHPTLPLPSYARVTNLANGRSMVVRVNDRGPYHADRVMDVSEAVADALEFRRSGTSRVRVEYVGKASVAGSDDRKLLATLRTDGSPAPIGGRSPIMVADLGPDRSEEEPLARARAPLAFRPAEAPEPAAAEEAPAPRPQRAAPVLVAAASTSVAVPAALQPGAARAAGFRPAPVAAHPRTLVAAAETRPLARVSPKNPVVPVAAKVAATMPAKASLHATPLRLASAGTASFGRTASAPAHGLPMRVAGKAAPMPETAKRAMARLAALPPEPPRKPSASAAASPSKASPSRRARYAGIDD